MASTALEDEWIYLLSEEELPNEFIRRSLDPTGDPEKQRKRLLLYSRYVRGEIDSMHPERPSEPLAGAQLLQPPPDAQESPQSTNVPVTPDDHNPAQEQGEEIRDLHPAMPTRELPLITPGLPAPMQPAPLLPSPPIPQIESPRESAYTVPRNSLHQYRLEPSHEFSREIRTEFPREPQYEPSADPHKRYRFAPRSPAATHPFIPPTRPNSTPTAIAAYDVMRKWNLKFSGHRNEDAEAFLNRLQDGRLLFNFRDTECP
ncbi:vegetative cell wall protein gp1-like [Athalia rosae]|uniref:vegetative cell wall protein gp1-like n=1 Tax=Athalia rosae TaxID=37344 RepID=UPI002033BC7C|nr:vegetative cell wall protein gp1-like [Athalia rosae]